MDSNEFYLITKLEFAERQAKHFARIELVAIDNAQKSQRKLLIKSSSQVKSVCERLTEYRGSLKLKGDKASLDLHSLPFIRYTKHGWVRDAAVVDGDALTLCVVFSQPFSCLPNEKEQYGEELELIESHSRFSGI